MIFVIGILIILINVGESTRCIVFTTTIKVKDLLISNPHATFGIELYEGVSELAVVSIKLRLIAAVRRPPATFSGITLWQRKRQHLTDFVCLLLASSYRFGFFGFSSPERGRQSIL
jgi:hypothetical protein